MKWEIEPRESWTRKKNDGEGMRGERSKDFLSLPLAPSPIGFPFTSSARISEIHTKKNRQLLRQAISVEALQAKTE